jgi:RNA-directed DNA polymerase
MRMLLGVSTVSDRIAQMVVKQAIERNWNRSSCRTPTLQAGKTALDAGGVTRQRCWKHDCVLEFDIKGRFDNLRA